MGFKTPLAALPSFLQCNSFLFLTSLLIITVSTYASRASMPLCLSNQSSALLQFKSGISSLLPGMLSSWKKGTNCCQWEGVTCDRDTNFVIGLQIPGISDEDVYGNNSRPLDPSLFKLSRLQVLDLGNNTFNGTIPTRLGELTHLTHLDLSSCHFSGIVPLEISQLTRLVYLDLSNNGYPSLRLENGSFTSLVRGLRQLQHLSLDGVDLNMSGGSVSAVTSSAMPGLQALSLTGCGIFGILNESILQLHSLSYLDLSWNNLSYIPEFFQNFSSLRALRLIGCEIVSFPSGIFRLPKLETLDISNNEDLVIFLLSEAIPRSSNIQYLDLSYVKLYGDLVVLSNLTRLSHLDLSGCKITGAIPEGFCSSSNLTILHLQSNFLHGTIPSCLFNISSLQGIALNENQLSGIHSSIFNLPALRYLSLNDNQLSGEITTTIVNLPSLNKLSLSNNMLTGSFPSSLLNLPSLESLNLANNKFSGSLPVFFNLRSQLKELNLRKNCFSGGIPSSISTFSTLQRVDFSFNHLSGTIDLFLFLSLQYLQMLDLSNNKKLMALESSNSSYPNDGPVGHSMLGKLYLSSCNMKGYPQRFLHKLKHLSVLDISGNDIGGKVPSWLWEIPDLEMLILNGNKIEGFEEAVNVSILQHSHIHALSAHNNHITGVIPAFICNFTILNVLDLSNNGLTSTITDCLGSIPTLTVVNLANNQLQGQIPGFMQATSILFNNSNNLFCGKIEMEEFQNCTSLEVLNLGNNQLNGTFPFWLSNLGRLQVLVLSYNHLQGPITLSGSGEAFSSLRILDVSNNQFSGSLPHVLFKSLKAMMENQSKVYARYYQWVIYDPLFHPGFYLYRTMDTFFEENDMVSMVLTIKGKTVLFPKVMESLTVIDLSNNMFTDKISEEIGMLKNLMILNISNNNLSGMIPKSLGNLQKMEALDLSYNHLSGVIPVELSTLSFLAVLNLSYNDLYGSIPQDHQFGTFDESSFEGNPGLCGTQVHRPCSSGIDDHGGSQQEGPNKEKQWEYGALGIGFAVGLIMVTLPILWVERFSNWYWNITDRAVEFVTQVFLCKAFWSC